jgi:hypothetical protein
VSVTICVCVRAPPYPYPDTQSSGNACQSLSIDALATCMVHDGATKPSASHGQVEPTFDHCLCTGFNNGCDIGCDKCDGVTGQKVPCCSKKFNFVPSANQTQPTPWGAQGLVVDQAFVKSFNRSANRPSTMVHGEVKATVCDSRLRTLNTQAECGSPEVCAPPPRFRAAAITTAC